MFKLISFAPLACGGKIVRVGSLVVLGMLAGSFYGCTTTPSHVEKSPVPASDLPAATTVPAPAAPRDAVDAPPELASSSLPDPTALEPLSTPSGPLPPGIAAPVAVPAPDPSTGATVPPACSCADAAPPKAPDSADQPRGRLAPAAWNDLPDWRFDQLGPALDALLQSCAALANQPAWESVCRTAARLSVKAGSRQLHAYFEGNFLPYQVINGDGSTNGLITGYYEPLLYGSRTRSERYRYPLYRPPDDLLTIDLTSVYPDLKGKRLRGRLEGNRVVPYYSRAEIETGDAPAKGKELVWVDDPVDVAFLQIQGSGQVKLDTGETMRVGYADQNGQPFRSVGRYLIQTRELRLEQTSLQGIRAWARRNPDKLDGFLNFNPSYVFFRELPLNLPGPLGALGVPLTSGRSIAVDQRVVPLGVPVYLATTWPNSKQPLNRLMTAQDTGGAINGAVRADFFWGFGDDALKFAGVMKQSGRMWVLLPKGMPPIQ